ncbi:dephospho-CoA kinase [Inquilinus sp. CAU 1745]|uniref:dephospho-CoA kinase n=1 Tax=Inquilinus sp. CAU 1745 TaxID=3140369 RepID=UPI00325B7E8F
MVIIGLTGSIGMGKTTAARMLRRMGVPVHDSDRAVRTLLERDREVISAVAALFPDAVRDSVVDRAALGRKVFADPEALERLEAILHPRVRARSDEFLRRAALAGAPVAVLDVPLLLETGGDRRCGLVAVVSAPAFVQRQRVLGRPGMTAELLAAILDRQMPDREKRRRADIVVPTGLGRAVTWRALRRMVDSARKTDERGR